MADQPDIATQRLLDWFHHDHTTATKRLEELKSRLVDYCRRKGFQTFDADEIVSEATIRTLNRLSEAAIETAPAGWFYGTVKNILLEIYRGRKRFDSRDDWDSVPQRVARSVEDQLIDEDRVQRCLSYLSSGERALFQRYYSDPDAKDRSALATEINTSPGALRVRIHAMKERILRHYKRQQDPKPRAIQ